MSRFNNLRERLSPRRAVESLVGGNTTPEPQGVTRGSTDLYSVEFDVSWPKDEVEEYWRLYETNPLIAGPIDRTATEITEPGWWVDAESEDTVDELEEFLQNVGIEGGRPHQDFSSLVEQAYHQYAVRGTFMAEKVTDENGRHIALNPLQSDTFEIYTKPNQNILLAPDDTDYGGVKITDDGKAAAFVQFDPSDDRWTDRKERRFARDQIIHWPRNPDVGDVRGTSRLEPVYERARALQSKFRDNDDAIAMKAWPMVLFQFGSEENPWTREQMEDFLQNYDEENFGPGMYQGVPGDINIEEFAGETADIESAVKQDVDFIISQMPGPKYALGSFSDSVSTTVASAQERQYRKLVRGLRRDIEDKITPYLVDVAESWDLDTEGIQLHIGRPNGEVSPDEVNGSVVRYTSDVSDGDDPSGPITEPTGGSSNTSDAKEGSDGGTDEEAETGDVSRPAGVEELGALGHDDYHSHDVDELADPRLVSTDSVVSTLGDAIYQTLLQTRDRALSEVRERTGISGAPGSQTVETLVSSQFSTVSSDTGLRDQAQSSFRRVVEETLATLRQENHSPQIDVPYGVTRHRQLVDNQTSMLLADVRNVVDDMASKMRIHAQGLGPEASLERLAERVRRDLDPESLRQRARLIADIRIQTASNRLRLTEYRRDKRVTGITVINACTESTTELCAQLAGCGTREPTVAYFDDPEPLGEQLAAQVSADLYDGFDPLPPVPPFHFGCRSAIVPVTEVPGDGS